MYAVSAYLGQYILTAWYSSGR